jgi:hypothetical protein
MRKEMSFGWPVKLVVSQKKQEIKKRNVKKIADRGKKTGRMNPPPTKN